MYLLERLKMDGNWFKEKSHTFPGQYLALEVQSVLFHEKSKYQDVLIFQSKTYGRVMSLDGIINSTERDEHSYQEMISFLPLNSHRNPKKVLIVGGGDGGVARECAKHPKVEDITMVEIDHMVVESSKKYLPHLACGMSHPKVTVLVQDGLEYLRNNTDKYDVIIADLSDPDGPAEELFTQTFYKEMCNNLNPGGILCAQGESIWLDLDMISKMLTFCREIFPSVSYATSSVPTYTSGSIGYIMCSMEKGKDFQEPLHVFDEHEKDEMQLKYYDEDLHRSAFAQPRFVKKKLQL